MQWVNASLNQHSQVKIAVGICLARRLAAKDVHCQKTWKVSLQMREHFFKIHD
ncbi:hypothetical protein VO64_4616 [Pseudomonas synxantha]|uniref:Uncharacterized protein n=1 Tax=Pseudomonas synxantha TaxID=47883 RepID=A0AAU8U3B0_9PSED|nr:hypothetical protein VO64_4616 [Pseudomonas synxantha]